MVRREVRVPEHHREAAPAAEQHELVKPLWEVSVPVEGFDAAKCLLDKSQFTDSELAFLATGLLDGISK
jgi:hypothetical protein